MQCNMMQFLGNSATSSAAKRQKTSPSAALTFIWTELDNLLVLHAKSAAEKPLTTSASTTSTSIRAFDMDGTLIKTKSGKVHAINSDDWMLFCPAVPELLAAEVAKGAQIVIISNQKGISVGKTTIPELKSKVQNIVHRLNVPLIAMFTTGDDQFRKPRTATWTKLLQDYYQGASPPADCAYIGDAAGRAKSGTRKKDFSASDYKFALNLGINFHTPEAFFLHSRDRLHTDFSTVLAFDPRCISTTTSLVEPADALTGEKRSQEMIVLVGSPASGKSTFCTDHLSDYTRINQDTLGSAALCKKTCEQALKEGKSVVIDNTNRSVKARAVWIAVAKSHAIPVRCCQLQVSKDLVFHLNTFRALTDATRPKLSNMVIHSYFKQFEEVDVFQEGFSQLVTISGLQARENCPKLLTSFLL